MAEALTDVLVNKNRKDFMMVWMWYCNLSLAPGWDAEEEVILAAFT